MSKGVWKTLYGKIISNFKEDENNEIFKRFKLAVDNYEYERNKSKLIIQAFKKNLERKIQNETNDDDASKRNFDVLNLFLKNQIEFLEKLNNEASKYKKYYENRCKKSGKINKLELDMLYDRNQLAEFAINYATKTINKRKNNSKNLEHFKKKLEIDKLIDICVKSQPVENNIKKK
ncbi:MAG: hypothetical protein RsTaC01_0125 [Candidatus Paraimprobicoccus trichonymphae]|uniref:Uncharacterized protein n=1 Tax=Candidatus Paraimprobicoccus trichonymphae TaxID=3033793 RepID=A0AA48KZL9_9FIRM|nr:MAG: hypothetical protein RsTaC01_0125 [Candidatus Paraimprobicoccus trichonymphae]